MAAPTYFGSASDPADAAGATGAEPRTSTITPPGSMVAGDLVVVVIGYRIATASASSVNQARGQTWNGPLNITGANTADCEVYWCVYNGTWTGGDPAWTIAAQSGTVSVTVVMHVFRPGTGDTTWAVDTAIAGGAEASASPTVITGITPNNNKNVTLACWCIPNISTWGTLAGSGWAVTGTAQYRNSTGSDLSMSFAHQLQDTKAATNDVSLIPSTAAAGVSFTIAWNATGVTPINVDVGEDTSAGLSDAVGPRFTFKAESAESVALSDLLAPRYAYRAELSESAGPADLVARLRATALLTNLTAFWELNEAANSTRLDSITTTPNDLADHGVGQSEGVAEFIAANSEYLSIADNAEVSLGGGINLTWAVWVKLTSKPANAMTLLAKWQTTGAQREYALQWSNTDDKFVFFFSTTGASFDKFVLATTFGAPSLDTWYLVFVTLASDGTLKIAVNNGTADTSATTASIFNGTANFNLGGIGNTPSAEFLDGKLKRVALWKGSVLSASLQTLFYNSGNGLSYNQIAGIDGAEPLNATPDESLAISDTILGREPCFAQLSENLEL